MDRFELQRTADLAGRRAGRAPAVLRSDQCQHQLATVHEVAIRSATVRDQPRRQGIPDLEQQSVASHVLRFGDLFGTADHRRQSRLSLGNVMNTRGQCILLWTTPFAGALFLLAYCLFPIFAPPLSPTLTPEQVAMFFREHVSGILGVTIVCNLICASLVPLFAVIALQMSRIGNSRSEEHTSELQSLMRLSYAVFCLK